MLSLQISSLVKKSVWKIRRFSKSTILKIMIPLENAQQRLRPPPVAAEAGRSCWGQRPARRKCRQGTMRMLVPQPDKRRAFKSFHWRGCTHGCEITEEFVWQSIPRRARDSHKGTFGGVLAVAGSAFYRGAALLAAEGCTAHRGEASSPLPVWSRWLAPPSPPAGCCLCPVRRAHRAACAGKCAAAPAAKATIVLGPVLAAQRKSAAGHRDLHAGAAAAARLCGGCGAGHQTV